MKNNEFKTCKTHDCDNEAIDGKYCAFCTQLRKEKKEKIFGAIFGVGATIGIAIKSGYGKKAVTLAIKAFRALKG